MYYHIHCIFFCNGKAFFYYLSLGSFLMASPPGTLDTALDTLAVSFTNPALPLISALSPGLYPDSIAIYPN